MFQVIVEPLGETHRLHNTVLYEDVLPYEKCVVLKESKEEILQNTGVYKFLLIGLACTKVCLHLLQVLHLSVPWSKAC